MGTGADATSCKIHWEWNMFVETSVSTLFEMKTRVVTIKCWNRSMKINLHPAGFDTFYPPEAREQQQM